MSQYLINTDYIFEMMGWSASVGGVMVSIDAFQALDPGSIPGHRTFFLASVLQ